MRNERFTERRRHKRVPFTQEVECSNNQGASRAWLADISVGGIFIDNLRGFHPGASITVRFRLPASGDPVRGEARVCYLLDMVGAGVQFTALSAEDCARIQDFVEGFPDRKRRALIEPRLSPRVKVNIPVTLIGSESGGRRFDEKTAIVSIAKYGARLRTERRLLAGMPVFLRIPDGFQLEARVVWADAGEVGVQCRDLAQALGFTFP